MVLLHRLLLILAGTGFTLAGIVGLVLPVLQGVLFIAIGIILLSLASSRFRTFVDRHTRRYPRLHASITRLNEKVARIVGRPPD